MGNTLHDLNQIRNIVRTGASVIGALEEDDHRRKQEDLNRKNQNISTDKNRIDSNEAAYQRGLNAGSMSDKDRYELKEMTCPNCGATMKPDELANATAALGSVDCPYCGSKIVLNDEVKNAEYVHKVEVEKKRTDLEARRQQLQEERFKAEQSHKNTQSTIDTIQSVDRGIEKAIHFGRVAIGCFTVGIIFIILIVLLIIFLINR